MEQEGLFSDLYRWGGNASLLELYQATLLDEMAPKRYASSLIYYISVKYCRFKDHWIRLEAIRHKHLNIYGT